MYPTRALYPAFGVLRSSIIGAALGRCGAAEI
jgi:hypothetical protein